VLDIMRFHAGDITILTPQVKLFFDDPKFTPDYVSEALKKQDAPIIRPPTAGTTQVFPARECRAWFL
jgi:hypothetical protein